MAESRERWSESAVEDDRLDGRPGVRLRSLSDIEVSRKVIVDNVYFVGLSVMRCYCGRFRYAFDDREPFTLEAGELVVVYPEHYVTIEALEARNRLVYCVCDGVDAVPFFDGLGFFDCARGRTSPRMGGFLELRSLVEDPANKTPAGHAAALRYLADMLVSQLRDLKTNGNAFLYEAARLVHANLKKGLVRLEPLCAQLKVSRSHLHKAFVEAGWPSPSEIIRREQLRLAVRLLREGRLSIPEVMDRAGFVSQSHFSTFIRKKTGRTPREIRCGQYIQKTQTIPPPVESVDPQIPLAKDHRMRYLDDPMELKRITDWIDAALDVASFSDVSNNGLQIARKGTEVTKVAFGVDASVRTVEAAVEAGAQLLVVHHGISWGGGIQRLTGGVYNVVKAALDADLALYAVHLPLDANHRYGNNYELARYLGLKDLKPAFVYHGETIGCIGTLPNGRKVGVCSGGAGGFAPEAKELGCDLYITGEADWGETIAAENVGMQMICAGHYQTETFGVQALARAMKKALKVETVFIPRPDAAGRREGVVLFRPRASGACS